MILSHDRIHTFAAALRTASNPWGTVQAVRVQGGRVVAAGARADVLALRERGEAVDEPGEEVTRRRAEEAFGGGRSVGALGEVVVDDGEAGPLLGM